MRKFIQDSDKKTKKREELRHNFDSETQKQEDLKMMLCIIFFMLYVQHN